MYRAASEQDSESLNSSALKRRRSHSLSFCTDLLEVDADLLPRKKKPPSFQDLDRLNKHTRLEDFGKSLQQAANAIFPANQTSKYSGVDVLLLSWEDEDPKLPVSFEIEQLAETFEKGYGYDVESWLIPAKNCHNRLQGKILQFLGSDEVDHLKIVYYGGHGRLTNHGQLAWTSLRDSHKDRCPTIRWSGIQSTLEESPSDVLILLDCCAAGVCTTDEGNGVTEMIAACPFNAIANGVGQFSFTHALNEKLRLLERLPGFTIGYLYNAIFSYVQNWRLEDWRFKKPPVHLVLTQNSKLPRSIRLSKMSKLTTTERKGILSTEQGVLSSDPKPAPSTSNDSKPPATASEDSTPGTSLSPETQLPEWPRLLLSIRFSENVKPNELSTELFKEWLRSLPALANAVKVEAGFASDSTLILVSIPASLLSHLAHDPAIELIGTIRSGNLLQTPETKSQSLSIPASGAPHTSDMDSSIERHGGKIKQEPFDTSMISSSSLSAKSDNKSPLALAYSTLGEPFRQDEKRILVTEALKSSKIPNHRVLALFQEDATISQPDWGNMLLPRGRTIHQCKAAFESMISSVSSVPTKAFPPWKVERQLSDSGINDWILQGGYKETSLFHSQ